MKIKLEVSKEKYNELKEHLTMLGFEICDDSEFVFAERNIYPEYISCKKDEDSCHLPVNDIVYIESMGHNIIVHTLHGEYKCTDRLWQFEKSLNPAEFLRISNSVIIHKKKIKRIKSALSQKFMVTMADESIVDVTRSYYYLFKSEFGI